MDRKKISAALIVSAMVSLLVLSFFSGCMQVLNTPPLDVTINSACKTTEIGGVTPRAGTVFVVVNMTVENRGDKTYEFDNESAIITNGRLVQPRLFAKLTNHRYWGLIPPHAKRTGEVIFGASDDTQDFTITFLYNNGEGSFDKELGTIPMSYGSSSPDSPQDAGDSKQTGNSAGPLNVTIHSASKTMQIQDSKPYPGYIFVIVNMTIENLADTDYLLDETAVTMTGGGPLTQKLYTKLANPLYWGSIPSHEKRTGEVVFGVDMNTQDFVITILDAGGRVILNQDIGSL